MTTDQSPTLEQKARRYLQLKGQIDALQEEADTIRVEVKRDLDLIDVTVPVTWQGVRISMIPASVRYKLDKGKLVSAGVTAAQIEAGQVKTEVAATARIIGTEDEP